MPQWNWTEDENENLVLEFVILGDGGNVAVRWKTPRCSSSQETSHHVSSRWNSCCLSHFGQCRHCSGDKERKKENNATKKERKQCNKETKKTMQQRNKENNATKK